MPKETEVVPVETIDLQRVSWINDPSFTSPKKTLRERLTLMPGDERDPNTLEQHRRFRGSMGLYPEWRLVQQNVTVKLGGMEEDGVWDAGDFFRTMPLNMFMEGPKAKGWSQWCRARDAQLTRRARQDLMDHYEGLDRLGGG